MVLYGVPPGQRCPPRDADRAPRKVEGLLAGEAPEMVMMPAPNRLVARPLPRQLDEHNLTVLAQCLDRPVNGRDA